MNVWNHDGIGDREMEARMKRILTRIGVGGGDAMAVAVAAELNLYLGLRSLNRKVHNF